MVIRALKWVLGALLFLCVISLVVPWHPMSELRRNQISARKTLTAIWHAQQAFKSAHGTYATLAQLANANPEGPIAKCHTGRCAGYEFVLRVQASSFVAKAYLADYPKSGFVCYLLDDEGNSFSGRPLDSHQTPSRGTSCRCAYRPASAENIFVPGKVPDISHFFPDGETLTYCADESAQR